MRLTALDIREQQFRRVMRGLDPDEVVAFLGAVATEYELLVSENRDLRQRLLDLEHQIGEFRSMEKALRDTLLTAERVTAETRENAQKEADLILRQAEMAAQQSTAHISSEILQKRRELSDLQRMRKEYLFNLRALAASHLEMIESDTRALENEAAPGSVAMADTGTVPLQQQTAADPVDRVDTMVAADAVVPSPPIAAASEVPTEVVGVIPSAVPVQAVDCIEPLPEVPTVSSQAAQPATVAASEAPVGSSPPAMPPTESGWAEAAFEPGDLLPRDAAPSVLSEREAERYRRGIAPNEPLPSLLREPGPEAAATGWSNVPSQVEQVQNPLTEPLRDGDDNWPTHAVRPDGSQGE